MSFADLLWVLRLNVTVGISDQIWLLLGDEVAVRSAGHRTLLPSTRWPSLALLLRSRPAFCSHTPPFASAQYDFVYKLNQLPFLIYAAKLCPRGVEASMFSLFMGLSNFGTSASEYSPQGSHSARTRHCISALSSLSRVPCAGTSAPACFSSSVAWRHPTIPTSSRSSSHSAP